MTENGYIRKWKGEDPLANTGITESRDIEINQIANMLVKVAEDYNTERVY